MACPTCGETMQTFGSIGNFWCPRCGTIRRDHPGHDTSEAPKLVERCRAFEGGLSKPPRPEHSGAEVFAGLQTTWRSLGIAESINRPAPF